MSKLKDLALAGINKTIVTLRDGTEVNVRSMLVKEYKQLMIANSTESDQTRTIYNILEGCVLDDIDLRKIPVFDFEKLYLEIWKLSKGSDSVKVKYICKNQVPRKDKEGAEQIDDDGNIIEGDCNEPMVTSVNLNNATFTEAPESNLVKINDAYSVKLRYPTVFEHEFFDDTVEADLFDKIMRCITEVVTEDETMVVGKDIEQDDLKDLIEYMDDKSITKMADWISSMPMITANVSLECSKCGNKHIEPLVGLADFFA